MYSPGEIVAGVTAVILCLGVLILPWIASGWHRRQDYSPNLQLVKRHGFWRIKRKKK